MTTHFIAGVFIHDFDWAMASIALVTVTRGYIPENIPVLSHHPSKSSPKTPYEKPGNTGNIPMICPFFFPNLDFIHIAILT
jgi:hypothetical protein